MSDSGTEFVCLGEATVQDKIVQTWTEAKEKIISLLILKLHSVSAAPEQGRAMEEGTPLIARDEVAEAEERYEYWRKQGKGATFGEDLDEALFQRGFCCSLWYLIWRIIEAVLVGGCALTFGICINIVLILLLVSLAPSLEDILKAFFSLTFFSLNNPWC
jgi:hypothetical protein